MSDEIPEICGNLKKFGYKIISSDHVEELLPFESRHSDMQCLKIKDKFFVLKNCCDLFSKLISEDLDVAITEKSAFSKYPSNVLLNCLYINNKLYCKESAIDNSVKKFCTDENIEIINVNQGYSKCSTAVIGDTFITSDKGIYKALRENGVEGLLINSGDIDLNGVDYGFIGGCCFADEYNVYFTGDVTKHKDYEIIENSCYNQNKNIICLTNKKLYDIGGFIII